MSVGGICPLSEHRREVGNRRQTPKRYGSQASRCCPGARFRSVGLDATIPAQLELQGYTVIAASLGQGTRQTWQANTRKASARLA